MVQLYLDQREKQKGGDDIITVNGKLYSLWVDSERPKTAIETAMYDWSLHASNRAAVQLAFDAESAFRDVLERDVEEEIKSLKESREKEKEEEKKKAKLKPDSISFDTPKPGFLSSWIIVPLATLGKSSQVRQIIRALLPKAIGRGQAERQEILEKYKRDGRLEIAKA